MESDIRTYRARSMQEAIDLVRRDLGPDASVLHTRQVAGSSLSWSGRQIEVTASASIEAPARFKSEAPASEQRAQPPESESARSVTTEGVAVERIEREVADEPLWDFEAYRRRVQSAVARDLNALRTVESDDASARREEGSLELDQLDAIEAPELHSPAEPEVERTSEQSVSESLAANVYARLVASDVDEETASGFAAKVAAELDPTATLQQALNGLPSYIEEQLSCGGPITVGSGGRRVIALVGPTGVGKTTTIAKLAADFRLRQNRRVGLITFDTYRIAAVEQLRTYADIIDLPMIVVSSLQEIRGALDELQDLDLVLMDTAGRSPRDDVRIRELRAGLEQIEVDEVHLVLSCAAGARSLQTAAERFQLVGVDSLILTKLDEVESLGGVLTLMRQSKLPLRYVTDGQDVPEDIQVASSKRLAERIAQTI